jgi:hypothetical protein
LFGSLFEEKDNLEKLTTVTFYLIFSHIVAHFTLLFSLPSSSFSFFPSFILSNPKEHSSTKRAEVTFS